jgi:hypothetical protein
VPEVAKPTARLLTGCMLPVAETDCVTVPIWAVTSLELDVVLAPADPMAP